MKVKSPCIKNCELNEKKVCVGCGRTVYEIANWRIMSNEQKQIVIDRISEYGPMVQDAILIRSTSKFDSWYSDFLPS